MPRPKRSKNKTKVPSNIDEQIAVINAEIEDLKATIKTKKAELKKLEKAKVQADKAAAEKKAEEEQQQIIAAVLASGKSFDEIIDLLK